MKEHLKNFYSFFLRFGISGILLVWIFTHLDFQEIWMVIKGADANYIIAAGLVFFAINFLILWRWMIVMKALDLKFHWKSAFRWFFFGLFWNLCLPTSVGGDVIKGLGLSKETKHKPKVFASIVLDRLSGFSGIVIMSGLAFVGGRSVIENPWIIASIAAMAAVSLVLVIVLFNHRVFSWVTKVFSLWPKVTTALMSLHYDIVLMKGRQKETVYIILISIAAQVMLAFVFYLTAKGLHQDLPFKYFIIFSPLVCVATALPSIGGLGIREYSWAHLLFAVGVAKEIGVGLAIINSGFMYMVGILMGGLLYVIALSSGRVQYRQASAPHLRPHP